MAIAPNPLQAFIWGRGGAALTPEQVAREREIAEALMKEGADYSPVGHWLQGAARLGNTLSGKIKEGRAASQEAEGRAAYKSLWDSAFGGGGQSDVAASLAGSPATSTAMATAPAPDYASARVAQAHGVSGPQAYRDAIASIESKGSGDYAAVGPRHSKLGRALGRYQVMEANIGPWSEKHLGRRVTAEEFMADPAIQDAIFDAEFGSYVDKFGDPGMAAQAWFAGPGGVGTSRKDSLGTSVPEYARKFNAALSRLPAVAANEAMVDGSLAGVPVAETEQDILAQEAAMAAQDPMAFQQTAMPSSTGTQPGLSQAAPPLPDPQMVQDRPVAAALTNASLTNPDLPLAGGTQGFAPLGTQAPNVSLPDGASFSLPDPSMAVAQSLAAQQQQQVGMPNMQQLMQLASDPWANDAQRQVAAALMKQQMEQNDPYKQAQLEKLRLETDQLRSGAPSASSSFGNLDAQARAAGLVPGTPQYQEFMLNGGGAPATFRALDMQAQAAGFTPGTPEYNEFMATRGAGLQAGAAQTAKNVADIDTGGAAAGAKIGGQKTMEAGFDAWKDYGKLQTSIGNMDEAIAALDNGAQTGIIYKMLPNITEASASLQNAMDRMGLDVIGSVTFGALSEGEMRLAMQTAAPRDLPPAELRNWLAKKRDAQIKAADMLADAAQFLTKPGNTINDWIERNRAAKKAQGTTGQSSTGIQWSIED